MSLSQCAAIQAWLEAGHTLTPAEAFSRFGTLACHSRIAELRQRGIPVVCDLVRIGGKTVGLYRLAERKEWATGGPEIAPEPATARLEASAHG